MPVPFAVELNGKPLKIPGGDDLSSMGVNFFCMARWAKGHLNIGGLRSRNGAPVDVRVDTPRIVRGDTIRIRYLGQGPCAPPLDPALVNRTLAEIRGEYEAIRSQIEEGSKSAQPADRGRGPAVHSRKLMEVVINGEMHKISALLDESAQLQAGAQWGAGKCTFRVSSVFSAPDGQTSGEEFIYLHAQHGQEMLLTYVL